MIPARKAQEHNEAIALRLAVEALHERVKVLEAKIADQEEKSREKLNVTPAHGYGMFDR